jgi:pimeloyl-ACP methyl ester carboxylesterase
MGAALSSLARAARVAGLLLVLGAGCTMVRVEPGGGPSVTAALRLSIPGPNGLSARTRQELYRRDLGALYPDALDDLAARLHADAVAGPTPAVLIALAEVNYTRGSKAEKNDDPRAVVCYLRAVGYAGHYLFPPGGARPPAAFDPRFRVACDLYNTALARAVVLAQETGQLDPRGAWVLPGADDRAEPVRQQVVHIGLPCPPDELGPLQVCASFQVVGLATMHRTFGLGVPLVGQRRPDCPARPFVADLSFPVTALCRFEGGLDDLAGTPRIRLELINPLNVSSVKVGDQDVPLETDLTTPLAHYLGQAHLERDSYRGFVSAGALGEKGGLHFFTPYQPGKVPVILVHGLVSSPAAWAPLLNDLLADPLLRQRFQVGVYFYPTGAPYLASAADLRDDLDRYRRTVDPQGKGPLLNEMVVLGHSMGGLVARLLTVDGGDDFWRLLSPEPLDRLNVAPPAREELRRTFYFHRESCIRRVVFLGTPHHGSKLSVSLPARLAARLAGMPQQLLDGTRELARLNPGLPGGAARLPSSVDLLAPDGPALALLAERPRPAGVHYHSVIGVALSDKLSIEHLLGGDSKAGDGVVSYESAHRDDVDSELVVQANHYRVHQHPLAVREVRRILLEHLEEIDRRRAQPVTQARAQ